MYILAYGLWDQGSIPGWVIPKTKKKMVLDTALLNTQQHMVWSNPRNEVVHPLPLSVVAIHKD